MKKKIIQKKKIKDFEVQIECILKTKPIDKMGSFLKKTSLLHIQIMLRQKSVTATKKMKSSVYIESWKDFESLNSLVWD